LPTKMEQTQEFWKLLLGGNLLVPLVDEQGATFVDANCLFGEYAMDLARDFPKVQVIGIGKEHNSPVAKPSNCTFIVEDIISGTSLTSNSCQFVQSRDVSLSLKEEGWKRYLAELYRILGKDGWIQVLEMDVWRQYPESDGAGYKLWSDKVFPALAKTKGVCVEELDGKLLEWAQNVGFTDITPLRFEIPVGFWEDVEYGSASPSTLLTVLPEPNLIAAGKMLRDNLLDAVDHKRALVFSVVMDRTEAETIIASAKGELYDDAFCAFHSA